MDFDDKVKQKKNEIQTNKKTHTHTESKHYSNEKFELIKEYLRMTNQNKLINEIATAKANDRHHIVLKFEEIPKIGARHSIDRNLIFTEPLQNLINCEIKRKELVDEGFDISKSIYTILQDNLTDEYRIYYSYEYYEDAHNGLFGPINYNKYYTISIYWGNPWIYNSFCGSCCFCFCQ